MAPVLARSYAQIRRSVGLEHNEIAKIGAISVPAKVLTVGGFARRKFLHEHRLAHAAVRKDCKTGGRVEGGWNALMVTSGNLHREPTLEFS